MWPPGFRGDAWPRHVASHARARLQRAPACIGFESLTGRGDVPTLAPCWPGCARPRSSGALEAMLGRVACCHPDGGDSALGSALDLASTPPARTSDPPAERACP